MVCPVSNIFQIVEKLALSVIKTFDCSEPDIANPMKISGQHHSRHSSLPCKHTHALVKTVNISPSTGGPNLQTKHLMLCISQPGLILDKIAADNMSPQEWENFR